MQLLCPLCRPSRAETGAQRIVGASVHPTRILARYAEEAGQRVKTAAVGGQDWVVRREFGIVPGLVALEPARRSVRTKSLNEPAVPGKELQERIEQLRATGLFSYVEPDYILHALVTPNDAAFTDGRLWGLRNQGQSGGVGGADISAEEAWDITTGSTNVIVAIIDSGIRYTHRDLANQMWKNPGEIPGNGIDDDRNGFVDDVFGINAITGSGDPFDENDHGTHVAGTVGAAANDGNPHVGVAWNARLMACKFLDSQGGGTTSDAIECINYAVEHGARILNNSWGGGPFSQALFDAIASAGDRGVLFVAAAGNESRNNDTLPAYPASYSLNNVISVAASDRANNLASFSNFGRSTVHVAAPGVDIFSSTAGADNEYKIFDGTSMAAPHVSGAAALLFSLFPRAGITEVRQRLQQGVVAVSELRNRVQSGGRLNAFNALTASPDGTLEVNVSTPAGTVLTAGSTVPIFVKVTDLFAVTNATVTGTITGLGNLVFANDGASPDAVGGDDIYSASLDVPPSGTGITLTIAVAAPGKTAAAARVDFAVARPPPNDAFANRISIDPSIGIVTGTNRKATRELREPRIGRGAGGHTVWWSWTPAASGVATVSTAGSTFDTVVAAFTGSSLDSLQFTAANDDVYVGVPESEIIFPAVAGQPCQIAVDGVGGDTGDINLNVFLSASITNDLFESRIGLTGDNVTLNASNFGAGRQAGEPVHAGNRANKSVWWEWIAPETGPIVISTSGSTFDTILAVYTGTDFATLGQLAANDDVLRSVITTSEVRFDAVKGAAYQIAVDSPLRRFNRDVGNITLSIVRPAANDDFVSRIPLGGPFANTMGHNLGATREPGEPRNNGNPSGQSVWWSWTAPSSGNATITTAGSNFDTFLAVYGGGALSTLTRITANDDLVPGAVRTSQTTFQAQAGKSYQIAVDGFPIGSFADSGIISLTIVLNSASRLDPPIRRADGAFQLSLEGEPGRMYVIEATSNLADWTPIATNMMSGKSFIFTDRTSPGSVQRFYRAFPASLIE